MYGYIYKTTNLINNKIYIGQHRYNLPILDEKYLGSGKLILEAINKYGKENFSCKLLEICETEKELNDKEIYWISFYNSTDTEIGYNISQGGFVPRLSSELNGMYGKHHSEDTKKILSEKRKLNPRIFQSQEEREKRSKTLEGHEVSEETREKLRKYNLNKISITNGVINKTILPEYLDEYIKQGFYKGRIKVKKEPRIWVTNDTEQHLIKFEDLNTYISKGYYRGKLKSKVSVWNKGLSGYKCNNSRPGKLNPRYGVKRAWVYKDDENRQVKLEELEYFLSNGYKRGRKK